jgi:hypothetical protein
MGPSIKKEKINLLGTMNSEKLDESRACSHGEA